MASKRRNMFHKNKTQETMEKAWVHCWEKLPTSSTPWWVIRALLTKLLLRSPSLPPASFLKVLTKRHFIKGSSNLRAFLHFDLEVEIQPLTKNVDKSNHARLTPVVVPLLTKSQPQKIGIRLLFVQDGYRMKTLFFETNLNRKSNRHITEKVHTPSRSSEYSPHLCRVRMEGNRFVSKPLKREFRFIPQSEALHSPVTEYI
ncbi:hypothetical protein AAG570_009806 [Ranatra chinensis]|uniref:Ribosomal protein S10 n=1 Tax=Ranatra chinensis TaxID=642074 RepID=A0ABD0YQ52_9HEMI